MATHKAKVHHHISFPVLLLLGLFLLVAIISIIFSWSSMPLLRDYFVVKENSGCTLEAKVCPDGSTVGRTGPSCSFAPCTASDKLSPEELAIRKAYSFVTWTATAPATLSYTDFSNGSINQVIPVQTAKHGNGKLQAMTGCFRECEKNELRKLGWTPDMNQAADSPTMSIWGYKKTVNGKTQLLQLSYRNNSTLVKPNQPIEIICPCSVEYDMKITTLF